MADNESDLETDGLELALDALCKRHCSNEASLNSKEYCSAFCKLVEEYTGQWHVPLPQLKVLRTALHSFTKATAAFPDGCQHIHYVISSLALSFFELMLFFSKEEFVEEPLKDILDSFQGCHNRLLRHRNVYLQHVKQIIKAGGPWENVVLQGILKEAKLSPSEIRDYLSSELAVFFELRVRYLQACERIQEAMALAKTCLENREVGNHLYFHQAYLTCLYKASLYESLHKEMAEIDGRDAVEIICNTESVEKDELLLSLCKAFLTQQLLNGDMYYIWDLVFIWSRLHLRTHRSKEDFLAECLQLASSAANVRAIFPFIKLVTTELGNEGIQVCMELCARALQLCDMQVDSVTPSLVCKTIAFLLPHDLEICRACALLVFCQERSLEAYRTVCLLYTYPDQESHSQNSPVRTCDRFYILQMLKERLCFDPEFWNLLTLRTHCLELISDTVMKAVVLNEMEEEEKEYNEKIVAHSCVNDSRTQEIKSHHSTEDKSVHQKLPEKQSTHAMARKCVKPSDKAPLGKRNWTRRARKKKQSLSDDEYEHDDDPEFKYKLTPKSLKKKSIYSLRYKNENSASLKLHLNRNREYLSRCVKNQILKRNGRNVTRVQIQTLREKNIKVGVERRGRKRLYTLEISYPENEMHLSKEESGFLNDTDSEDKDQDGHHPDSELEIKSERTEDRSGQMGRSVRGNGKSTELLCSANIKKETQDESQTFSGSKLPESPGELQAAVEADPTLDGRPLELLDCPIELFHSYSFRAKSSDGENPLEVTEPGGFNGNTEQELRPPIETEVSKAEIHVKGKRTWKDRLLRTQQYAHLTYHCKFCHKDYKGLNVTRHALSHLKSRRLRCILCGKHFKQFPLAKKHVLDHIDSMSKEKPHDLKPCKESNKPAANGTIDDMENQSKNQSPVVKQEQKPSIRIKVSSLKKEERIIRNLRTLIKKTSVLHKKSPNTELFKHVEFKDEQVAITDSLVIVRRTSVVKTDDEQEDGKEMPPGENGYDFNITYHLCPSEFCDKVFLKVGSTLTKHAIKCHINEDKVLEKTFVWAKQKCTVCFRQLQFLQHYKDHMKLHFAPLPHFCYHLECVQRFASQQELKDHIISHQPFRPQCSFADCESLFSSLTCLHDHEWRHYIPAPQKEELELGPRQNTQNDEAPWKQRVKVEQLWLQNKKGQRESSSPNVESSSLEDDGKWSTAAEQTVGLNVQETSENLSTTDGCADRMVSHETVLDSRATINGHEATARIETEQSVSTPPLKAPETPPAKRCRKNLKVIESDPINVRHLEGMSTLAEGLYKNIGEPHITEHKSFKPEDPAYATFVKAPFIRPPPSTYLDESVLAMRKRRTMAEASQKTYVPWNLKKKEAVAEKQKQLENEASAKTRHRCDKCLSSFSTPEELQTHRSQNKCSSLFGFDSDDEC